MTSKCSMYFLMSSSYYFFIIIKLIKFSSMFFYWKDFLLLRKSCWENFHIMNSFLVPGYWIYLWVFDELILLHLGPYSNFFISSINFFLHWCLYLCVYCSWFDHCWLVRFSGFYSFYLINGQDFKPNFFRRKPFSFFFVWLFSISLINHEFFEC